MCEDFYISLLSQLSGLCRRVRISSIRKCCIILLTNRLKVKTCVRVDAEQKFGVTRHIKILLKSILFF